MASIMQPGDIVVGLGEALWDMLTEGKQIGGAPANFAYHAGQCGLANCVVSAIGEDKLGEEIAATFQAKKLDYVLELVEYPTGTVQVTLSEDGVPSYEIREGVAWDNIPFTAKINAVAQKTRCVCFGSLAQRSPVSRETIGKFIDAMPKDGGKRYVVFDVNLRQNFYTPEVLAASLGRSNVMKINDEELILISRMFGYPGIDLKDKCWLILGKYNLDILILTCGINGSYVFSRGQMSYLPTPVVEVVDTVGAGDAFSAAFMGSVIQGASIEAAHHNAVAVSAFVCANAGAMPQWPDSLKAEVMGRI